MPASPPSPAPHSEANLAKGSYGGRALQSPGGFADGLPLAIILLDRPDTVVQAGDAEYEVGCPLLLLPALLPTLSS